MPISEKPRIAIASCHDKNNFGSMLQAYATQAFLENQGYDVRTIDKTGLKDAIAVGRRDYYARNLLNVPMYQEKVPFVGHRVKQKVDAAFGSHIRDRYAAFDFFEKWHFNLTRQTSSFEELSELSKQFDAVVVGSDQLWLPVNISGDYFTLSWVAPDVKKVAYATSFGVSTLDDYYQGRVRDFLANFSAISVREASGASLVEMATGQRPRVVCDPTMLLSRAEWLKVASKTYQLPAEPYLLCYFMGNNHWQRECAVRYAREHGLKIVAVAHTDTYIPEDDEYADIYPWDAGPAEWLSLFSHASFVCTDSFHGTVFSNIFRVPFCSFRRHSAKSGQSTNSRIDTLLDVLDERNRLCQAPEDFALASGGDIDFSETEKRLKEYSKESAGWLLRAVGEHGKLKPTKAIHIFDKQDCCGCSACAAACPKQCITMEFDAEGCEYPQIDESACIECGRCSKVCPILNVTPEEPAPQKAFLVQNKDARVLAQSTSGGAFTAFATTILERGGVVFGAGYDLEGKSDYDAPLNVRHFAVESVDELWRFRNSKYVQSEIGDAYAQVKRYLSQGREVLFSGTPCQCEGLLHFLGCHPGGLYVADVVCRAVPARSPFKAYLEWLQVVTGEKPKSVLFRDKGRYGYEYSNIRAYKSADLSKNGWDGSSPVPFYSCGVESDPMLRGFFSNLTDRPSCYQCRFKKRYRISDLTMWDCFDVYRFDKSFDDNRGVTRVLVHSERGQVLVDASLENIRVQEIDVDSAIAGVREMAASVSRNPRRGAFFADLEEQTPDDVFGNWFAETPLVRAERGMRHAAENLGVYSQVKRLAKKLVRK